MVHFGGGFEKSVVARIRCGWKKSGELLPRRSFHSIQTGRLVERMDNDSWIKKR